MKDNKHNVVLLVSGSGTNAQRIIDLVEEGTLQNVKITQMIADRECSAMERAARHGIPSDIVQRGKDYGERLLEKIDPDTDLIVLAGFLSLLSGSILEKYRGRIINLHPSLLPKFGGKGMWGMHVHNAVIEAGEKQSGATVHYVTAGIDEGEIILQGRCSVSDTDTPESLAEKVHQIEYEILPEAIAKVLSETNTANK